MNNADYFGLAAIICLSHDMPKAARWTLGMIAGVSAAYLRWFA